MAAEPPASPPGPRRTRQSPGEGGKPRRRADGRWDASLELPPGPDGRRRRKSVYGATKTEALQKLRALKAEVAQGRAPPPKAARLSVGQYLADWLERERIGGARPRTLDFYGWAIRTHLAPALGAVQLARLTRGQVQDMLDGKRATLSATSIHHLRNTLRAALSDAERRELVPRNVARLVEVPRAPVHAARVLTPEEAGRLLAAAAGHRLEAMVSVALALGLRPTEYLGLTWPAVDLAAGHLSVRTGLERAAGALRLSPLKTRRGTRSVRLPRVALEALRAHRERQALERDLAGAAWEAHGLVFCTQRGRPLGLRNVERAFKTLLARAGLPREIRLYDVRHSCASLLLAAGVPPRAIMELLGHSAIATTMDVYAHVLPALARETADAMDRILDRPGGNVGQDVGQDDKRPPRHAHAAGADQRETGVSRPGLEPGTS